MLKSNPSVTTIFTVPCDLKSTQLSPTVFFLSSDLVISAQKIDGPESFVIEIEQSKIQGLLGEFEGDFGFLA